MKWVNLLNDIKGKVGLAVHNQQDQQLHPSTSSSPSPASSSWTQDGNAAAVWHDLAYSSSSPRSKHELELDFKRFWEVFRSSGSEKEKEVALNMSVDAFCKLLKQQANVAQLVTMLVEIRIFSFVVGRAFVTDVEKLTTVNKTSSLDVVEVVKFFTEARKDGMSLGSNLLTTVEVLVSVPIDMQSLLDSGILCCLVRILNALMLSGNTDANKMASDQDELVPEGKGEDGGATHSGQLEVEGKVVHIMKALATHPSAARSLAEDDSLQLLFQMVVNGSLDVFSQHKDGIVSLHLIQLHKHAMQILGLLLVNDSGSTAKYISKHQLIKVLLTAIKDFNPTCGDAAYTMGIVDILLDCVELSYKSEAGGVRLREDIHNAHGHQFLVQFALTLSTMSEGQSIGRNGSYSSPYQSFSLDLQTVPTSGKLETEDSVGYTTAKISPALSRLLDVLVNLAQLGPAELTTAASSKCSHAKGGGHGRTRSSSADLSGDETWETNNSKVKDLKAVQMLQDIFLKSDNAELQAEVLDRMFKIFSSHIENYKLCQQLRTVPLLILNMEGFPPPVQDIILKILEYAVTVVNCIPEQELLSLCCLLQQPITANLKHTILSFFVKLLSFDQRYKKVLREVGVLEVLLDDLKNHKAFLGSYQENSGSTELESNFKKHLGSKDTIITSPRLISSGPGRFLLFETDSTISIAWDCMVSLLKRAETNQSSFRSANGVTVLLPFLVSDVHRQGVLRTFSCLIMEDIAQAHPDELGALLEVLKSGIVISASGSQFGLNNDAKSDIFGALCHILGVNSSAQRLFGEATGFSLLLTTLNDFRSGAKVDNSSPGDYIKVFTCLMRAMTAGVHGNAVNRTKLHTVLSSHSFYDLLCESGLLCVDSGRQVIHLFLELALEIVLPPILASEADKSSTMIDSSGFVLMAPTGVVSPDSERVYNAGAVMVIIRALLLFTPKVQLDVLDFIEKLASAGPFNQENLTAAGCVELLLDMVQPFLSGSSSLLSCALRIIEILGAYRLSNSELRLLMRYTLQMKQMSSGCSLVGMMERLILMEDVASGNVSLAPFMLMDMSKVGHASIHVPMGERSWPPVAGYSFACWFQFRNFLKSQVAEDGPLRASSRKHSGLHKQKILRVFSVGSVDSGSGSTFYAELYLQEDGVLTLATSNSSSISFSGLELEEGQWHHLAVVHSKPNALAGLFQSSVAYIYVNGKLRHTGKLGYSPSPVGKALQIIIGTPVTHARVSGMQWKLCSCYLFEEVLSSGCVYFMYILGRGYRGLFQDTNLLQFVPNQACGGDNMAILDTLEADQSLASGPQRPDAAVKTGSSKADGSGIVWDLERLGSLPFQLSGKKLISAFDGTCTEALGASGALSLLNLVDPTSAAASPIGGIPRFGHVSGDITICRQCVIGDAIRPIGGMAVVLALVEAAETKEMLHMALALLACVLHQNPRNLREMQACRGYHLLSLFLYRRMSLFDMYCLEIFFKLAACEASFSEPKKLQTSHLPPVVSTFEGSLEDLNFAKFREEFSSVGSQGDMDDFSATKDTLSRISELDGVDIPAETSNCIVLSNADMVEHVLLDWTLWVTAPVSIQIALLGFVEHLVSIHWYRNHNLTVLRKINLVQHLLVTLQRGDVEVPVLEKLVILLGVILEDGFLASELESVVRFVIMTFDPPVVTSRNQIPRESMGKHVIVRNMLLEMLIDLQMTIKAPDLLEQWHKTVSSKLITYFLDEAVHPTSMRWIMTLLGVCLTCSPTFQLKFRTSGGYQGLTRVLSSFYDSPDIYYILFCLIFGKPVYPRLPEVRMLDFHALIPSDGNYGELKFVELLDSVIAMAKSTFDRVSMRLMVAHQNGTLSTAELADENADMIGELQGEALMHKTYAARLMGGEASAPAAATSVLRFMVDLAKMCPAFSVLCRRVEILENCIGLYFSCARAFYALKLARSLRTKTEEKNLDDCEDNSSPQNTFSSLPRDQEQSAKTSVSVGSYIQGQASTSSEDMPLPAFDKDNVKDFKMDASSDLFKKEMGGESNVVHSVDDIVVGHRSTDMTSTNGGTFQSLKDTLKVVIPTDSQSSASMLDSPTLSEKSNTRITPASPAVALSTLVGGSVISESKVHLVATPSVESSVSNGGGDQLANPKSNSRGASTGNAKFVIDSELLLEMDHSGYGGGSCTAGSTAVLDFIAEVLSDVLTDQIKAVPVVENILESTPLYIDSESTLVFQGLCFSRIMNFLERRLLRDDEESGKKLDKNRWSTNLDALCWLIVDRVYMGAFPRPVDVLRNLEFLLSMLQLANKDGRILEAPPSGIGLLPIGRGSRPLEAYIHAILKNTNRMILYCFLPSFLSAIGEEDLLSALGLLYERKKSVKPTSFKEESDVDICTVLQLLDAHMRLIFCPSNIDKDLTCCLCINLISLLHHRRQTPKNIAIDILKYLLVHRRAALEDLLASRPNQGPQLDVLHGGFDKLLNRNLSSFMEWFRDSEQEVNKVLERCAGVMWVQYIAGSSKFPGVRIKGMDGRRRREMGRKVKDISMLELKHWEQLNERRYALELVRDAMSAELRVVRQDKYGWVLHAESEWQTLLQHLVHERGIFPVRWKDALGEPGWQLCPIEGPYRTRKKLDRCKLRLDAAQDALDWHLVLGESEFSKPKNENNLDASDSASGSFSHPFKDNTGVPNFVGDLYDESSIKESDHGRDTSSRTGLQDDRASSINEPSLHSAIDFGNKSVGPMSDNGVARYDSLESPRPLSSVKNDELSGSEDRSEKELLDNGEYLIRPYLEPLERIRFKYNCERVVGLDKRDGVFLIGELCLYVIENFYIDDSGCLCEKASEGELSVIDQALGVKKDLSFTDFQSKSTSPLGAPVKTSSGGRAWAYNGGAWGKEKICTGGNIPHLWRMWKLNSVREVLKRDYQLRPVAIEIFSMDGCNDILVFHKKEREEVFKNLVAVNLPRNSMLDTTISGLTKQESNEGSRLFKLMAKSFSKRWQNGEISNFQYLMHLNTLAGRGYSDLTQYPVFPWILADYESEDLDLSNPLTFRALDRPMGCQTEERKEEFRKRYESWDDPEVPKFHYGSHYSSAGIVLFYLIRLPPFSMENQKLQGGQFDHADRLFNIVRDTWSSAAGKGNTSDVKELIPEFFYMPEFLENRFGLDLGEKQSGEKVGNVLLPPWAKGSAREFIKKHREALECDYVSQNLHHWIDLIFGCKQRGKAAEEAVNVFYHYTYEGSVDIDAVTDPAMKASILAQINHFGQTPKQLFLKPHAKRQSDIKRPPHPLRRAQDLVPHELKRTSRSIVQIITLNDKILVAGSNSLLKPRTYTKYVKWGFPDRSLRFLSYDQDRLLSTHENLHGGNQIQCTGISHDGQTLVTGGDEGLISVWRIRKNGPRGQQQLQLEKALAAHTAKVSCLYVSQPYMLLVTGSDDCTVIFWDLRSFSFVRQLPEFQSPVSAVHVNDLTGEVVTAAGVLLAVWSINGDCLAATNTSHLPSDSILSVTSCRFSDWLDTNWLVTGHQSGAVKVWKMAHSSVDQAPHSKNASGGLLAWGDKPPEYSLVLHKQLKAHKHPVTAVHLTNDLKQLLTGDSDGHLLSWTLPDNFRNG